MKTSTTTNFKALLFLLFVTVLPRFWGLGYSEFYGDETKTLYWNKTVPAVEFLMNQRKGPVQFLAAWFMEKVTEGFAEFTTRLPFALAGTLSVFVLYFVVKNWFGERTAFISALLFSANGIFIAFSRTAQYQSFLWLFGFLAILAAQKNKIFLSGALLGLCLLSHYDGIFFAIPVLYSLVPGFKSNWKRALHFMAPLALVAGTFYLPYFLGGYFGDHTSGYLLRRINEQESVFSSLQTYLVYNPYVFSLPLVLLGLGLLGKKVMFALWFGLPFVVFELVFRSPGTHIQQYLIPLIIMSGFVIDSLVEYSKKWKVNDILLTIFGVLGIGYVYYSFLTFIPQFNRGYPWKNEELGQLDQSLYLYGFPYRRGWKQVNEHLRRVGANDFYTNDNVTVAEYYLLGIPANKFEPEFYIEISNSQLFKELDESVFGRYQYILEETIEINGDTTAKIYRRVVPLSVSQAI